MDNITNQIFKEEKEGRKESLSNITRGEKTFVSLSSLTYNIKKSTENASCLSRTIVRRTLLRGSRKVRLGTTVGVRSFRYGMA